MANDVATVAPQQVVADLASKYGLDADAFKQTIVRTCFSEKEIPNLTKEEFFAFLIVAQTHGLNPLLREIYAMRKKGGGIQAVVGVDGWLSLINRHPAFDGMTFTDTMHQPDPKKPPELVSITCRIHRKDRTHPVEVTEFMSECRQPTEPWAKWPARMLRHKATIQCARYAFSFAGIVDPDEAARMKPGELDGIGRADPLPEPVHAPAAADDKPRRGRPPKPTVAPPAPPEEPIPDIVLPLDEDGHVTEMFEYMDPDSGELIAVTAAELDRLTAEENRIAAEAEQRRMEEESAARVEATKRERAAKAEALRKQLAELDGSAEPEPAITMTATQITETQRKADETLRANPLAIPDFLKRKPVTAKNGGDWPSGLADPDAFLRRLDTELSKMDDGDAMQRLWEERVDPVWKDLFPPDGSEAQAILRHHMSKVAP